MPDVMSTRHVRTLVCVLMLACASVAVIPAGVVAAPVIDMPQVRVTEAVEARTILVFSFPLVRSAADAAPLTPDDLQWTRPPEYIPGPDGALEALPHRQHATVAVPVRDGLGWEVVGHTWLIEPRQLVSPREAVSVSTPRIHRNVPLATVVVEPELGGGVLGSVTIALRHGPHDRYAEAFGVSTNKIDGLAKGAAAVINPEIFSRLATGLAELGRRDKTASQLRAHPFVATGNWLEVEIDNTGVYRLRGLDFTLAGISLSQVDPDKLRVYRAWPTALPDNPDFEPATWQDDYTALTEIAIEVLDTDDTWDDADQVRFYAVGPDDWSDRFVDDATPIEWSEHRYSNRTVYWVTWESHATPSPLPGTPLRLATVAATAAGEREIDIHLNRIHREEANVEVYGRLLDEWAWDSTITFQKPVAFDIPHAVTDSAAFYMFEVKSLYHMGEDDETETAVETWLNDGDAFGESIVRTWDFATESHRDSLRFRLTGTSSRVVEGVNTLTLERVTTQPSPLFVILDSADMMPWQQLIHDGGQLDFIHWGSQVSSPGERVDLRLRLAAGTTPEVWDVTDPESPSTLVGTSEGTPTDALLLGLTRQPDTDVHLLAFGVNDLLSPVSLYRRHPGVLRATDPTVSYVLVYNALFAADAQRLAAHRATTLSVLAVDVEDIYDAFGGGVKDPLALRNFFKWLWIQGGGQLEFVCLLGDASRDYRHYQNQFEDFVPTVIRTKYPVELSYFSAPYAADDHLVSFDDTTDYSGLDLPDVAVGRLTVREPTDSQRRVDTLIDYDVVTPPGTWRNRLVFTADDFCQPSDLYCNEVMHMDQAEHLIDEFVPSTIDAVKLYMVDYAYDPGGTFKPLARQEAKRQWNDGLSIFHYIGHGSDNTLADEQVFLTSDIFGLTNGLRRGVFVAFSCDVGIFDSPTRQSMAETFTAQDGGGAIASIAASQVSFVSPNNALSEAFYRALYPEQQVVATVTLGDALLQAKVDMGESTAYDPITNSQKYNLLGDPAISLPNPAAGPEFHATSSDTLHGGWREEVVCVLSDHGLSTGAGATYDLDVLEDRQDKVATEDYASYAYWLPGATVFHGTGPVDADTLRIPFKVPVQLGYGEMGKARLIINTSEGSFAAAADLPVVQASTGEVDDFSGPSIDLAFADNRFHVKPGTTLHGVIADTSGVSILGTSPLNSVLLAFDDSGFMSNVSEEFTFDPGSYTAGRIEVTLPDNLALGDHTVALLASDVLGNVGADTLSFQLVAGEQVVINDVTLFPNPTAGPARLIFELSDPMQVGWSIYTLSGHLVYRQGHNFSTAGPQIMHWDGRDDVGDELANGVYLYVLKGSGFDDDGHQLIVTGKLVVMK